MIETKQEKPLELLVIESNPEHTADARAYFAPLEQKGIVRVAYASTLVQTDELMRQTRFDRITSFDGIISDVFFPVMGTEEKGAKWKKYEKEVKEYLARLLREHTRCVQWDYTAKLNRTIDSWVRGDSNPPSGVFVAIKASPFPVVLNTDTHCETNETHPVDRWTRRTGVPLITTGKGCQILGCGELGKTKDWRGAHFVAAANYEIQRSHPRKIKAYALDGRSSKSSLGLYFEKKDINLKDTYEERTEIEQFRQNIFKKYHVDKTGLSF